MPSFPRIGPGLLTVLFFTAAGSNLLPAQRAAAPDSALRRYEFTHPQMGTVFRLVFYAADDSLAATAARTTFGQVDTLNAIMSDYLPESELMRLCAQAGTGKKVPVSPDLWRILRLSVRFTRQSAGAFDPSIGPLTRLWRRGRNLQEVPDSARIEAAKSRVGFQNIRFYSRKHRIALRIPGMQLDLGGIAQGYAADACLQTLKKYGITRALADAGGDIAAGDPPPGHSGWTIGLPHAAGGLDTARYILARGGITTSGASFRYIEDRAGRRYSHIVDPRSGWGITRPVLVTVQAPSATEADAWATAISVLGATAWKQIRHKHPELQVWLTDSR